MSIKFLCEHCHKDVSAPDEAAGKLGKCPFCGQSNYVPMPLSKEDELGLAPFDEAEEQRARQEADALLKQERALLSEMRGDAPVPLEHREDLTPADLHHFVVNYCLDLAGGKLDQAETHVAQLRKFKALGVQAVEEFLSDKAVEPALKNLPPAVVQGFLKQLRGQLR